MVRSPRAVGAGVPVWGPGTVPLACMPCGAACRGGGGGPFPRKFACHLCEGASGVRRCPSPGHLSSGAGRWGSANPCVPGAVGAGVGAQHRPHSMRPCGPALHAVRVAEGRPRGRSAFRRREARLRSGAPPPPTACPLGWLSGSTTHVLLVRVCGCAGPALSPWLACPVGAACRGSFGGPPWGGGGLPPL